MNDIEILLKHTINIIDDKKDNIIDWDSRTAKMMKMIYDDYYINKINRYSICPNCGKKSFYVFSEKSTKKTINKYCDKCIILFK